MRSTKMVRGARISALLLALVLAGCGQKPEAMLTSAKEFLAKNDAKSAVIQIKNALQANPDLPEARYLLGKALYEAGDAVGAETELRKALSLKVPEDQVVPLLAAALLAQGKAQKVVEEFGQTALTQATAKADLLTTLAYAYNFLGKGDKSDAALSEALKADGNFGPALMLQARHRARNDVDGAMGDIDALLAKSPQNYQAWKLKGDLLLYAKNKPDEALEAFRKSIAIRPDFILGHVAATRVLFRQNKLEEVGKQLVGLKAVAPNHPMTKTLEAQLAFQRQDFKSARALSQQALKVAPEFPLALQVAGATELQFNSVLQAESYLSKAVQLAPELITARRLLAATYARSGNTAKAIATLAPSLATEPVDPEMLSLAGEIYLQSGDAKKAEEFFAKAIKQDPQSASKRTALAVTRMAEGKVDSGLAELEQIAGSDSSTVADMALISALLNRQQYDKALKAIDVMEKKQPGKVGSAILQGRVYLAKKDTANARKSFERAMSLDPTSFEPVASLAGMDVVNKKSEEAKKRFEALLAKDPKNGRVLLALAELAASTGASKDEVGTLITKAITANPTDAAPRLLLVDFHLRNKDLKQALSVAQDAQTAIPDSPEVLEALGRTQQANGDLNQAITSYNKMAALQPMSPQPYMRLADAYMAAKDKTSAAQSLRKALEIKPDLKQAQTGSIMLDMDSKNYQGAVAMARTMQSQSPADASGYVLEGDINANQKKWDAATTAYRNGLKQSSSAELAIKLHSVLLMSGKNAEADKFSASWQKDHPKDVAFQVYLADGAIARKDYQLGERTYLELLKQQPNNAMIYNNLAWVTAKLRKDGAIAYAEKAVSIAPNQPAFMDTLAGLLAEKGEYDHAIEVQKKAVDLSRSAPEFQLSLAKIQLKAGHKAEARAILSELAKLGDKFAGQSEVANLLKE